MSESTANTRPSNTRRALNAGLSLYRHTLKRVGPLHRAIHWLITHSVIPALERSQRFATMPDDPLWFRLELLTGRHEHETTQQIRRIARPGMTVLDVGAHVGYYTRLFAGLVGPGGRVIAFEPHPRNYRMLQRNIAGRSSVIALNYACAESEGSAELFDYLMMSASGSLHYDEHLLEVQRAQVSDADYAPRLAAGHEAEKFTVRTVAMDAALADLGIERIDCIKMDIEGAEIGALRGLRQTIQRSPRLALVMEYNPLGLRAFGHDPLAALEEVRALGFSRLQTLEGDGSLRDLTDDKAALQALTERLTEHMGVINLLLTRGDPV